MWRDLSVGEIIESTDRCWVHPMGWKTFEQMNNVSTGEPVLSTHGPIQRRVEIKVKPITEWFESGNEDCGREWNENTHGFSFYEILSNDSSFRFEVFWGEDRRGYAPSVEQAKSMCDELINEHFRYITFTA